MVAEETQRTRWFVARLSRNFFPRPPRIRRVFRAKNSCHVRSLFFGIALLNFLSISPARAQDEPFSDTRDGGKLHAASGFVCPAKIGAFARDAAGEADSRADFCAYSARGGIYGTIKLTLLDAPYNARVALAPAFIEEESAGAKSIAESTFRLIMGNGREPLPVYTRIYETAKLEDRHYCVLFAGAQFKNWAVEATIEYVDPQDTGLRNAFLQSVFVDAEREIGAR